LLIASAAPRYTSAFAVNIGMSAMTIIFGIILRMHLSRLNKKLDRGEPVADVAGGSFRFLI
jgi:hypothetical protein